MIEVSSIMQDIGQMLSIYSICSDANQLNENIVATAESEAAASELEPLINYYTMHGDTSGCLKALKAEQKAYEELNRYMNAKSYHLGFNIGIGVVSLCADAVSVGTAGRASAILDVGSSAIMVANDFNIAERQREVDNLRTKRLAVCGDDWRKSPKRTLTPILDPSGIVYEAVESNVLSGVTATIYDMVSGSGRAWDAVPYDQTNPLTTDAGGNYAWDVPSGQWQVWFTKTGFDNAQTDTLTVPPPRMNLKTAMSSTAAPVVVSAAAYPDYVELVFSQYMSVTDALNVSDDYTYEWVNKEKVNASSSTEYSKVLHLKKKASLGETVSVSLSGAKNYADTALAAYSSGALTVAVRPAEIRLNYEDRIAVLVGEAKDPRVTAQVLDASGQPIAGLQVTAILEDSVYATITAVQGTTGEDGIAVFSVKGLLPGYTKATFTVKDTALTRTMPVRVTVDTNRVAKPSASIGGKTYTESTSSITVPKGTVLELNCITEGAAIYYTTNDTCPCQALDRQHYTEPIAVNENTYFRIAAYKKGMEYSERLNLTVTVSSGGAGDTGYGITAPAAEHGSVRLSKTTAAAGEAVTITLDPDKGYALETLIVTDRNGEQLELTRNADGSYSFEMPSSAVEVKAAFMEDNTMLNFFVDVPADAYFYDAVLWAVQNGITEGTSDTTFSPEASCTRAQVVTFLWRAAGEPVVNYAMPFTDVPADAYYTEAVRWAVSVGITEGTSDTGFSPDETVTRGQFVTFLYRMNGIDTPNIKDNPFEDVEADSYYFDAVLWAAETGVTEGVSDTAFDPDANCTRGQTVTFIYRHFAK